MRLFSNILRRFVVTAKITKLQKTKFGFYGNGPWKFVNQSLHFSSTAMAERNRENRVQICLHAVEIEGQTEIVKQKENTIIIILIIRYISKTYGYPGGQIRNSSKTYGLLGNYRYPVAKQSDITSPHNNARISTWCWVMYLFIDFCSFWSVAVNMMDKLQTAVFAVLLSKL